MVGWSMFSINSWHFLKKLLASGVRFFIREMLLNLRFSRSCLHGSEEEGLWLAEPDWWARVPHHR
jgi:hypothetical protein